GLPAQLTPGSTQFVTTDNDSSQPLIPNFDETTPIHIPGEVRNMLEICQVESILEVNNVTGVNGMSRLLIPISVQSDLDQQIASFRVDPGADGPWQSTLLGNICRYYNQWSGSLEITFMFTGSFMATGKILIGYSPPGGSQPATREDAMLGTYVVWDFGLQSSVTLAIPWISNVMFRNLQSIAGQPYFYAGIVTMWYQTNFVVPDGAPTSADIIALGSAQSNFSLRLLKDSPDISQTAVLN
nr:1C (VP3) [Enterovirus J]